MLMVGHVLEYHPGVVELERLVSTGELGTMRYIYSNRLSFGRIRKEENILWSFAPHDIAVILRLVGALPTSVIASGASFVRPGIADVTLTHLIFDNDVRAHIHVSWLHPFKEQRLVVIGSEKMVTFDDVAKKLVVQDQLRETSDGSRAAGVAIPFASTEPLRLECEAFLRSIQTRTPPLTDGLSGLRVLSVLHAAERSLEGQGRSVSVE